MSLDVDGILHVTAIEKETGKSKHITIARALEAKSPAEIAAARERMEKMYSSRAAEDVSGDWAEDQADLEGEEISEPGNAEKVEEQVAPASGLLAGTEGEAKGLIEQSRRLLDKMHPEDKEEVIGLHERISAAVSANDPDELKKATADLRELLFFVEGH